MIWGIFYIMSYKYKKVKELVKRIEELEEMQDYKE